jgi:predicted DNA-binding transcriptional regulator AlpA
MRPRAAAAYFAMSIASLWREVKSNPRFPRPLKLGPGRTVFLLADCERYLSELVAERDAAIASTS